MIKNTANQSVAFEMLSTADGSPIITGTPTVYITGGGGAQSTGAGSATHKGNGVWSYTPAQSETNYDHVVFTMVLSGAFSQSVNIYTTYPQSGDAFTAVGDLNDFDPAADTVANVVTVGTCITNTDMRGTDNAALASALAVVDTNVDAILTDIQSGGYENGMIWINTVDGVSGATPYVHGTVVNPVNNLADALTLSASLKIKAFFLVGASSITLSQSFDAFRFYGKTYSVNLNGQSVSGTYFDNGYISGDDSGSNTTPTLYDNCIIAGQTLGKYVMRDCKIEGNVAFAETGEYDHHGCSFVGSSIQIDFGATIGNSIALFHGCAGNISALNMGSVVTDVLRVAGIGEVNFAASCVAGTAYISGVTNITDSSGGAVTINYDANVPSLINNLENISAADVNAQCDQALIDYDGPTKTELDSAFSALNDPSAEEIRTEIDDNSTKLAAILTDTGTTLEGHLTDIKGGAFNGTTDSLEAIRDRGDVAWITGAGGAPPDLLQSTTIANLTSQTTFTLSEGSSDDNTYNDQIIIITDSVTGTQKAVGTVSAYIGSTKQITLTSDPGIFTMSVGDTIDIIAATGAAGSGASASEVWSYSTRVLTAGTNLNDISVAEVNAEVDAALSDYDGPTKTELDSAFTEIKGSSWSAATDTLENIRDKQTDIETKADTINTNVNAVLTDTNELQSNQGNWETATGFATSAELALVSGNVDLLVSRLTDLRAGYLDKLNVTGTIANSNEASTYKADVSGVATSVEIAAIDLLIDSIKVKTDNLPADPSSQAALISAIPAAVFGEILVDIAAGELDAGQDITLSKALRAIFNRLYRLVVQTSTEQTVSNDSGVVVATMATSEVAGVSQTKGEAN